MMSDMTSIWVESDIKSENWRRSMRYALRVFSSKHFCVRQESKYSVISVDILFMICLSP